MASVLDSFNLSGYSLLCRMSVRVPVLHLLSDRCRNFELEVDSWFSDLLARVCWFNHRTDHRSLALSLYLRRVVRRSVVELSLRIFLEKYSPGTSQPKIGNSLYSYTLLEYFSYPNEPNRSNNELNRPDNDPKKAVIRLKKIFLPFRMCGRGKNR